MIIILDLFNSMDHSRVSFLLNTYKKKNYIFKLKFKNLNFINKNFLKNSPKTSIFFKNHKYLFNANFKFKKIKNINKNLLIFKKSIINIYYF